MVRSSYSFFYPIWPPALYQRLGLINRLTFGDTLGVTLTNLKGLKIGTTKERVYITICIKKYIMSVD